MARSVYIYYAQQKAHPADPAYAQAFTVLHELVAWLGADRDLYQVWRMPDGPRKGCAIVPYEPPALPKPDPDAGWKRFRDMCS